MNLDRVYTYRFRDVDQRARDATWSVIAPFIFGQMDSPDRILDPAAGRGEFIAHVHSSERWAVDLVDQGISRLPGVHARIGSIDTADLPADYFDGIFVSNLLEHLADPDSVAEFLARMLGLLRVNGRIAVMGPNFRYCAREYFDCADHILALSHVAVEEHLFAAGFDVERVVPRFLPYSFRSRLPSHPALVKAYLGFSPAWRLAGKQFLVIASRPPSADQG